MNEANEPELDETGVFIEAVSDEALEAAASLDGPANAGAYTIAMCTGLQVCPF
jgi:hypothetical protein